MKVAAVFLAVEIMFYRTRPIPANGGLWVLDIATEQVDDLMVLKFILDFVASDFVMQPRHLIAASRKASLTRPRLAAAYLMRHLTPCSIIKIGKVMGRHHSSVVRMCQRCAMLKQNDDLWAFRIDDLQAKLVAAITALG